MRRQSLRQRGLRLMLAGVVVTSLLLISGSCPPPPPPRITEFVVAPMNTCARIPVAVSWRVDAESASLSITPPTGETPPEPLPSPAHGGFRFATAASDTTFTLTARRGSHPAVSESRVVHIVPNPFLIGLELQYDCANRYWVHPGFTEREFAESLTVETVRNDNVQPVLIEHYGQLVDVPPGETRQLIPPTRFAGARWVVRLSGGGQPSCGGDGSVGSGPVVPPPPMRITVTSSCPRT